MKWFLFPIAVVATSLALVVALVAVVAFPARAALASALGASPSWSGGPWHGGPWHGGPGTTGAGFTLPAELQGLAAVPPDQRFSHFDGAQVNLKDKDGKPLTITATPGTVTAASATGLTLAANDGTTKTFALNAQTMIHGASAPAGGSGTASTLGNGDKVVVVTLDNSTTATAVIAGGQGFGWSGPAGARGPAGTGH